MRHIFFTINGVHMKRLGRNLLFFGIGSIVLNLVGMQFIILSWIDTWGDTVGWAIRGTIIVAGAVCFGIAKAQEAKAQQVTAA